MNHFPFDKVRDFDSRMRAVAAEMGILFICDKGWLVELKTEAVTSIAIEPNGKEKLGG